MANLSNHVLSMLVSDAECRSLMNDMERASGRKYAIPNLHVWHNTELYGEPNTFKRRVFRAALYHLRNEDKHSYLTRCETLGITPHQNTVEERPWRFHSYQVNGEDPEEG